MLQNNVKHNNSLHVTGVKWAAPAGSLLTLPQLHVADCWRIVANVKFHDETDLEQNDVLE